MTNTLRRAKARACSIIMSSVVALIGVFALSSVVFAAPPPANGSNNFITKSCSVDSEAKNSTICQGDTSGATNPVSGSQGIVQRIARLVQIVAGVGAVLMVIIGGFEYVLSAGDSAKVNSAKNTILYALIGLVICILAQIIIVFVIRSL